MRNRDSFFISTIALLGQLVKRGRSLWSLCHWLASICSLKQTNSSCKILRNLTNQPTNSSPGRAVVITRELSDNVQHHVFVFSLFFCAFACARAYFASKWFLFSFFFFLTKRIFTQKTITTVTRWAKFWYDLAGCAYMTKAVLVNMCLFSTFLHICRNL